MCSPGEKGGSCIAAQDTGVLVLPKSSSKFGRVPGAGCCTLPLLWVRILWPVSF